MQKSYSELRRLHTFEDRYEYLRLGGVVGRETFGFDRYLNLRFYASKEWRNARRDVIVRDEGCDLGVLGRDIQDRIYIHHMNPMRPEDIVNGLDDILDPEFLISVTHATHNAIHYGDSSLLATPPITRTPGDTTLWPNTGKERTWRDS